MSNFPPENERHEPLPLDPIGQRLCLSFPYLWQAIVSPNEPTASWQTLTKYPLRPRVLWRLWQDASQLVGVRFDHQTSYGLIDIDAGSPYHPTQDPSALMMIRAALETIGISRIVLVRSSWSGGLHLYIPLPQAVPTFGFASALQQCLTAQGMALTQGQLEVFPNCKAYAVEGSYSEYNGHRLPLQPQSGSCLLDEDGNPVSRELRGFFEQWDWAAAAQDMEGLRSAMATARTNRRGRRSRQSNVVEEWLSDLRTEMAEGWTGYGQTNHLLKTIACYGVVFEGLKGDELIAFIQTTAIQSPGYLQWCRHQEQIGLKAAVWARAAANYYWKLGEEKQRAGHLSAVNEPPQPTKNEQRAEEAQRRIESIVRELEETGELPATTTARARLLSAQGISTKTLYRYLDLWHPDHRIVMEQLSKTAEPERDRTIESALVEVGSRSLKSRDSGEFYTVEGIMKGKAVESGPALDFTSSEDRQLSLSDQDEQDCSPPSSDRPSTPFVQLGHPQLKPIWTEPDRFERLRLRCSQLMQRGDRRGLLQGLLNLWRQGSQELVTLLCQTHPEWGFAVGDQGPLEVR